MCYLSVLISKNFTMTLFNDSAFLKEIVHHTSNILLAFLLMLLSYYLSIFTAQRLRLFRIMREIPGPEFTPPLIGNVNILLTSREKIPSMLNGLLLKFGAICRVWVFSVHVVIVSKAEYVENIFNNSKNVEKSVFYNLMEPWLGSGLLTSKGNKWHLRRKMITPAFHFTILSDFVEVFIRNSNVLAEKLKAYENVGEFGISEIISAYTLDNICETAMGLSVNAQTDYDGVYVKAINSVNQQILRRIPRAWLWSDLLFMLSPTGRQFYRDIRVIHAFTIKVIQERRAKFTAESQNLEQTDDLEKVGRKKMAFLDLLLHASQDSDTPLTDVDLREEVDTFMFEGFCESPQNRLFHIDSNRENPLLPHCTNRHCCKQSFSSGQDMLFKVQSLMFYGYDTTASALVWALFRLGLHQDCQERCAEELRDIFDGSQRAPSMHDLARMKYLEQVIKEVLRHYPSVPFIGRKLGMDTACGKYLVPDGTNVGISIYDLHRDAEQFPDPEVFNPDHFSAENTRRRHPYAFIPFSAGPRNCIGQKFAILQMKVTLSTILRSFIIETSLKPEEINITFELILRFEPEIKIKLRSREKNV